MTAVVFFFFSPVQRRKLLFFLQWCCNGWEEDDELRKADYGVGSATVFVLLVALVSRQPTVVDLSLLCRFCVMSSPCSVPSLLCFFFQAAVLTVRWAVPGGSVVSNGGERDQRERL